MFLIYLYRYLFGIYLYIDTVDTNMNTDNNVQIGVRLPPNTVKKIDKMVSDGDALNRADAVRNIVRKAVEQEGE